MLKLKKAVVAAVLGVGCVASAQASYEGVLGKGTLTPDKTLTAERTFGIFDSNDPLLINFNANVLDWYTFSVNGVSSATGALTSASTGFNFGVGFKSLTFSVYEGTYTDRTWHWPPDVLSVALPGVFGLKSVGSFGLLSDGTLAGDFNFTPGVNNYTLVITGFAVDATILGSTKYTFTLGEVSAVPEPAEYAMLLAGLAVIGSVVRRRKIG